MKNFTFSRFLLLSVTLFCFVNLSCKKASISRCGTVGGIYDYNHYLFWINYDSKAIITVQVKDTNGKLVDTFYPTTSVYYNTGQPTSCSAANCARFDLNYGSDYTYNAYTSNGHSWSGSIQTSCDPGGCVLIQLK